MTLLTKITQLAIFAIGLVSVARIVWPDKGKWPSHQLESFPRIIAINLLVTSLLFYRAGEITPMIPLIGVLMVMLNIRALVAMYMPEDEIKRRMSIRQAIYWHLAGFAWVTITSLATLGQVQAGWIGQYGAWITITVLSICMLLIGGIRAAPGDNIEQSLAINVVVLLVMITFNSLANLLDSTINNVWLHQWSTIPLGLMVILAMFNSHFIGYDGSRLRLVINLVVLTAGLGALLTALAKIGG